MLPSGCYSAFYDKNGISIRNQNGGSSHRLKEMHLVSCYSDKTLMYVEIFEAEGPRGSDETKSVLDEFETEKGRSTGDTIYGKEKKIVNDNFTYVQRFAIDRKYVYIVTAARRGEPNQTMTTFLDSVKFPRMGNPGDFANNAIVISSIKPFVSELGYEKDAGPKSAALPDQQDDVGQKKLIILSKPSASYTPAARRNKINGSISVRLNLY